MPNGHSATSRREQPISSPSSRAAPASTSAAKHQTAGNHLAYEARESVPNIVFSRLARPVGGSAKRWFDITAALAGIVFLLPLFCFIALAIKLSDRGPVFYRHRRVGFNGAAFDCLKFRSIATNADEVWASPSRHEQRGGTRVGGYSQAETGPARHRAGVEPAQN